MYLIRTNYLTPLNYYTDTYACNIDFNEKKLERVACILYTCNKLNSNVILMCDFKQITIFYIIFSKVKYSV